MDQAGILTVITENIHWLPVMFETLPWQISTLAGYKLGL